MRRAHRAVRRLSPAADRPWPPRGRLRADGGSRRGEEARAEIRGAARCGAAGDAGHHHRGSAARPRPRQCADGAGPGARLPGRLDLWPCRRRHLHRRLHAAGMPAGEPWRRGGAHGPARDRGWRNALPRARARAVLQRLAHSRHPHGPGGRGRGAGALRMVWGDDAGWIRRLHTGRDSRRRRPHPLCGAHPAGRPAPLGPSQPRPARRDSGNRCGHARQSGAGAHPGRRPRGLPARLHRHDRDLGGRALAG